MPPPMTMEFATDKSHQPELTEEDISVKWMDDGNVVIQVNGVPFLLFTQEEKRGFCKSIAKSGIYGNAWSEEKFRNELD